jgi:hypothetical protein
MTNQTHAAALGGLGTTKNSGATLASSTLATVTGAALPAFCKHADIRIVTGTVYIENDGTAADANAMPFTEGEKFQVRNSEAMLSQLRFFADAAYDMRIALYL